MKLVNDADTVTVLGYYSHSEDTSEGRSSVSEPQWTMGK